MPCAVVLPEYMEVASGYGLSASERNGLPAKIYSSKMHVCQDLLLQKLKPTDILEKKLPTSGIDLRTRFSPFGSTM